MDLKQASIADRTHTCLEGFHALIRALEKHGTGHGDDLSLLAVEDQMGRLRLWAGNIGALQEGRSSLDYRLRDAKFVVQNVQRLLDSLHASLIRAAQAAGLPAHPSGNRASGRASIPSDYETSSESSSGSDLNLPGDSELAGQYLIIAEVIGRLFKLSIAIRSPSLQNAAARSASFIERDDDGNDLSILFEQYVLQRIIHHYPDLPSRIAERLCRAVGRRRRQFTYQRRHREKLGRARHRDQKPNNQINLESDNPISPVPQRPAVATSRTTDRELTVFHRSILSETTTTQYVPRPEQPQAPSTKSFSTASGVFQGSEIDIPPPISPEKDQEFECPYCFFILSGEFKDQRTWRKHVFDDLEPYVCLFEDCSTPDQAFYRYKEWVYHEDWSHNLQWCCDLGSHDLQLFDSKAKFEDHLQEVHDGDVENVGLHQLIGRNQRPAPILWTECPFCKFVPNLADIHDVSAGFSLDELASKKLIKHIGHHLQSISTLALPWRDDLKDDASSELIESAKVRDRTSSSQVDTLEVEEMNEDDEMDLEVYKLDLRPILPTIDQQWDRHAADFLEVDQNDHIIQDLILNQTEKLGRLEYKFTPLEPGRIRILRLRPGKLGDPVHCDRLVTNLHNPPGYKYLSYVWGSANREMSIVVGGESCMVTKNLALALRAIRRQDSTLTLWVDALCINEADLVEKISQLNLMPKIAQSASETIVWLGPSMEDSDLAMDFVGRHEDFLSKGLQISELSTYSQALSFLFARLWWTRAWVVQDVILSKSVFVVCGSRSIKFDKFAGLRNYRLQLDRSADYRAIIEPIEQMPFGDILLRWDQLRSEIANGTVTFFSLMMATRKLQCTQIRDKIFSVLPLCKETAIIPDYSKSEREVFIQAMQVFLGSEEILPLYLVEDYRDLHMGAPDLPSWVIDWRSQPVQRVGFAFDGNGARGAYSSGRLPKLLNSNFRNRFKSLELDKSGERILCYGTHLGVIRNMSEPLESREFDMDTLLRGWMILHRELWGFDPKYGHVREMFWRTLIANRLENFSEEPTAGFLEEIDTWFHSWVGFQSTNRFEVLIRRSCTFRAFAMTNTGSPSLVPKRAQVGDHICVLFGGDVPFVLRESGRNWLLIGEAYVDGFMDGEVLESVNNGLKQITLFSIC